MPLAFRDRLHPVGLQVIDTFNRPNSASLGSTSDGSATWRVLRGTAWQIANNKPYTTDGTTTNPLAVVETHLADIIVDLDVGYGNDALYFRVQDANNWLRLRTYTKQESYSYTGTCYYTVYQQTGYICAYTNAATDSPAYCGCLKTSCGSCPGSASVNCPPPPTSYCGEASATCGCSSTSNTCAVSCSYTGVDYYYYLQFDQCVSGTVTNLDSWAQSGPVHHLSLTANGANLLITSSVYGSTYQKSYINSLFTTQTTHGIGRGVMSSDSSPHDNQSLDNFSVIPN